MVLLAPLDSSPRASFKALTAAARRPDPIGAALSDAYPWVKYLPREERELFAEELTKELAAAASAGVFEPVALLADAWKATAEVYADPDLRRRLSGPIEITHGGRVPRPSG
ncbi:hypothetical protein [Candidatus Poriferisodalis sp.]|uniref:hypothetical protein n=1 Tax=Candidatus Poriferisodalis sp. TaxID=3101277 RepID=UPI003D0B4C92